MNTEIIWCCFGNPTRNTGRFRDCFDTGEFAHRWFTLEVDSRAVSFSNKAQIESWITDYGLDSDFIRVRVLGKFPFMDAESFIPLELAHAALHREISSQAEFPVILGVDVARFGNNFSVIYPRQGRDASSRKPELYSGIDTTQLTNRIVLAVIRYSASAVCVDGTGVGGGVVDQLRSRGVNVHEVQFGGRPDSIHLGVNYMNKRAEIWGVMREWLATGSIMPTVADISVINELTAPTYGFAGARQAIQLESKEMMARRGAVSPDIADALACTFAFAWLDEIQLPSYQRAAEYADYNPYSKDRLEVLY